MNAHLRCGLRRGPQLEPASEELDVPDAIPRPVTRRRMGRRCDGWQATHVSKEATNRFRSSYSNKIRTIRKQSLVRVFPYN